MDKSDSFCRENCKGFQETGKCFTDGDCKAKREAKSTNKVEPKFKVGNWIVFNGFTLYIKEVVKGCYRTKSISGIAITHSWNIDNFARLWTIEDAKDGDILAFNNEIIVIFKDLYNKTSFHSYCHIEDGVFNISKDDMPDWWEGEGFYPATRKQRDILFSKMKKAGYIFDFKKKELKKIKNEIEIPFGAKDSELQEATYYIPDGFYAEIDNDKVVIKKGEKPTVWSEDDERIKKRLINLVNEVYDNRNYITFLEHKELLAWLEKLDNNIEL